MFLLCGVCAFIILGYSIKVSRVYVQILVAVSFNSLHVKLRILGVCLSPSCGNFISENCNVQPHLINKYCYLILCLNLDSKCYAATANNATTFKSYNSVIVDKEMIKYSWILCNLYHRDILPIFPFRPECALWSLSAN